MLSILRRSWLFALLGLAALASIARAEEEYIPFESLQDYDTDYQFFEPAEPDSYGGLPPPNTGWYGSYQRMYVNGTRPRFQTNHTQGDFGWGNKLDIGYMTETGNGWSFSGMGMGGGVDVNFTTFKPRLAYVPAAATSNPFTPNNPATPAFDQPNGLFDPRVNQDLMVDSLNSFTFSSWELNRVWRLEPLHNGVIVEPFMGMRFTSMKDHTRRMQQFQIAAALFEQLVDQQSYYENSMWGGQVGVRLARQNGRLLVGTELRLMTMANFQHFNQDTFTTTRLYTAPIPSIHTLEFLDFTNTYGSGEEFVIGGDVRVNASYEITRDIAVQGGVQWMGFGKGIARGPVLQNNTGDFYLMGVTFGVSINR